MPAIIGVGATFAFATTASPTIFTTLDGTENISFSGDKVAIEKTTTMAVSNGVETFIGTLQDPGGCDVKCFFYPGDASQVALEAIRLAMLTVPMKVTYGTSNSCTFSGIVEAMTVSIPLDKPARLDCKIKVTGPRVYL